MANNQAFKIKNGLSAKRYLQNSTAVSASDVDLSTGSYFTKTLSGNTTFTFSNPPASGKATGFALEVTGADVTVAYDLANASYDSVSFSVSSQETIPTDIAFNNDGTKMFICGSQGLDVNEYSLSTAWDITTASYVTNFSVSSQTAGGAQGLFFKTDGTKMYITSVINPDTIYQYGLTTGFDLSTASYDSKSLVVGGGVDANALVFKPDGTEVYVIQAAGDKIDQWSLSTAWDISTGSYTSSSSSTATQEATPRGMAMNSDGTKVFIVGISSDTVYQYSLSTAYDISTLSYDSVSFSVSSQEATSSGIVFKSDGTKMYLVGSSNDTVFQYNTGTSTPATTTWPSSVKWSGATAPDAPASGEKDVYVFVTTDGGTTYYGKQAGDAVA